MNELAYVYGTLALMVGAFVFQVATRRFDPFAPIWLFFVGYTQVYVVQAISYHDWAIQARGEELVSGANSRALWALAWLMSVYFLGPGRKLAQCLPSPPVRWALTPVVMVTPFLFVWGVYCARVVLSLPGDNSADVTAEATLLLSFPMVMLVAGVLLIVTGRQPSRPRPAFTAAGVSIVLFYLVVWMFNGKRSPSLIAVLVGVCSFYVPRMKRPSFPVLIATAMTGALAVGIAIGWRYFANNQRTAQSFSTFVEFVSTFNPETILESVNLKEKESKPGMSVSYETEEYGGYLLMMDTVPLKSDYDLGANYLRVFSTFIPRIVWADKPIYGRDQWISAWVAGSEMKRQQNFTGPAISILGATQLNGGSIGTFLVMGIVGLVLGTSYHYCRMYADRPWVQVFWPLWYYNAWFMTVNDDPCNWFYYNFGFTTLPPLVLLWFVNKSGGGGR